MVRSSPRLLFSSLVRAITADDPLAVGEAARKLASERSYLAPLGWAASTIVLLVLGLRTLISNWRLTTVQLVPALWIWLLTYNIRMHLFSDVAFRHRGIFLNLAIALAIMAFTMLALWANTIFAFALEASPPHIRPALALASAQWRRLTVSGAVLGSLVSFAALGAPRLSERAFIMLLGAATFLMAIAFVAIPARILGRAQRKLSLREQMGSAFVGGAISIIAMTPGFILNRLGLLLIGVHGAKAFGFALFTLGTAMMAISTASVRAVKLSSRLIEGDGAKPVN